MKRSPQRKQPGYGPAAIDIDADLADFAALNIDQLRERWQRERSEEPPPALSKDLLARAMSFWLQEQVLGGLDPRTRKLLNSVNRESHIEPRQHVKVGSVIVREHLGQLHEVIVVPDGFYWQGHVHASLSKIAKKITGTSWNGPRFFGLRRDLELKASSPENEGSGSGAAVAQLPRTSVKLRKPAKHAGASQ